MYTGFQRYGYLVFNLVAFKRSCGKMSTMFERELSGQEFYGKITSFAEVAELAYAHV